MIERIIGPKISAITAVAFLGVAALNGVIALGHNNEAIRADAQAEVYQMLEQPSVAQQLQVDAKRQVDGRNHTLLLVGANLATSAVFAGASATGHSRRSRNGQ